MKKKPLIILTGGTGNVGQCLLNTLPLKGYRVLFLSRSHEKIRTIQRRKGNPSEIEGFVFDLEHDDPKMLASFLKKRDLKPFALINNARNLEYTKVSASGLTEKGDWIGEFTLGVLAPYYLATTLADTCSDTLKTIINVSSMYEMVAPHPELYKNDWSRSPIQYGTVKASMHHLTKELAIRFAPKGIRVNTISLGGIEGRVDNAFKTRYSRLCPQGRMLKMDEVVAPFIFLLDPKATGITGQNVIYDGGWSVW